MRVIHQEQERAVVLGEVAGRDVLAIADEVCEAERLVIQDANEALGSAAMLDIRLARAVRGRKICAVAFGAAGGEVRSSARFPAAALPHPAICGARDAPVLQ